MLSGHQQETIKRVANSRGEYIIAVQDTTYYNYTGHRQLSGIGKIQGKIKGLLQHNLLLMNQRGMPLGVFSQEYWTRKGGSIDLAAGEKESQKWLKGLEGLKEKAAEIEQKIVLVEDREADMFDFFKAERGKKIELLVRVHEPRKLELVRDGRVTSLPELSQYLPEYGEKIVQIRRKNREVAVRVRLKAGEVNVYPRADLSPAKHKTQGLSIVIAEEIDCVDIKTGERVEQEGDGTSWLLLTSLGAGNGEEVARVVEFYAMRWRIEQFHFMLKSGGLNVEKLQFDDVHTLTNALSFYSVIAWQMMAITYQVRENPEQVATTVIPEEEVTLLARVTRSSISTARDAMVALGKLIGFAPSKRQPLPGTKVVGQALERFYFIKQGFEQSNASPLQNPTR